MRNASAVVRYGGLALAVVLLAVPAVAQSVSNLAVTAATSKRVDLSWTGSGGSFTVQRRVLGSTYSAIGTVTNNTYSDTTIDPYTTYEYQVTIGSATSNTVRVGPPPAGLTNVAPAPLRGSTPVGNYGLDLSMVLDGNGDPAILFGWGDPNGDTDFKDSVLLFRSWNRAKNDWNPLVTVATIGDALTYFRATTSLAYDASSNTFVAASEQEDGSVNIFASTNGGTTWTKKKTFQAGPNGDPSWEGPSVAAQGGIIFIAIVSSSDGLHYVSGPLASDSATWVDKKAPTPAGTDPARNSTAPSLALDGSGAPAIAYFVDDNQTSYNEVVLYWRPATATPPVRAMDSQGVQTDDLYLKLAFFGLNPRILAYTFRKDADFGVGDHFVRSDNGGVSWQTPVVIPPDGNSSTDFPFDLTLNSKGEGAVGFGQNSGSGDAVCGNPKVSRSTDLVNWKTCAIADKSITGNFGPFPSALQIRFGGNDKLYLLWMEEGDTQANTGILMYREPPAGAVTGPIITGVVDGASFRPNIVAGSWVTIQGANLSDTTRTWGDADFNNGNNLPTDLSGVSVKMNGLSAAVYYISPTQLNVQAPANISGNVTVQVTHAGVTSNTATATAVTNAPALFAYTAGGKTYPAAVFLNSQIVGDPAVAGTAVSKAKSGDRILLYGTGIVPSPAGIIVNAPIVSTSPATVTVGGQNATVEFAGLVASGEFQINIILPNLTAGEYPVVVTVAGKTSQSGVIIPVQ